MLKRESTLYDLLGVAKTGTHEEIAAAYATSLARYHPRYNAAPNAAALTALVEEAWQTLGDPVGRAMYDESLVPVLLACDVCGKSEPYLRLAKFYRVWSLLIASGRTWTTRVYCRSCRSAAASRHATFSAFASPFGLPGYFLGPGALATAACGGARDRTGNARLLYELGDAYAYRGEMSDAATAFDASRSFVRNAEVTRRYLEAKAAGGRAVRKRGVLPGQIYALVLLVLFITIPLVLASRSNAPTH